MLSTLKVKKMNLDQQVIFNAYCGGLREVLNQAANKGENVIGLCRVFDEEDFLTPGNYADERVYSVKNEETGTWTHELMVKQSLPSGNTNTPNSMTWRIKIEQTVFPRLAASNARVAPYSEPASNVGQMKLLYNLLGGNEKLNIPHQYYLDIVLGDVWKEVTGKTLGECGQYKIIDNHADDVAAHARRFRHMGIPLSRAAVLYMLSFDDATRGKTDIDTDVVAWIIMNYGKYLPTILKYEKLHGLNVTNGGSNEIIHHADKQNRSIPVIDLVNKLALELTPDEPNAPVIMPLYFLEKIDEAVRTTLRKQLEQEGGSFQIHLENDDVELLYSKTNNIAVIAI